jgi:tRNA pseudouridine55 synthase
MNLIHAVPKTYLAEVTWGLETDNGDLGGKPTFQGDAGGLDPPKLDAALAPFLGWRDQVPPTTSAKKVGGEPAYRKVHRGEAVVLPPSRVYLHAARWTRHQLPRRSLLTLTCRGGYYVRALARDLGRALGCGAHLSALSRTAIGPWEDPPPETRVWIHGEEILPWCPVRRLDAREARSLLDGQAIAEGAVEGARWAVPEGFPDPQGPVLGVQGEKLVALLTRAPGGLVASPFLPRGV